jgi:amino acid adenylation domain-containing protein
MSVGSEPFVTDLIAAQARRRPGQAAWVCGERQLTYADLERQAGRLARRLRRLGVVPETTVAIALDRCSELAVSVLAVLKAGGCYLLVDVGQPMDRLAAVLAQTRPAVLIGARPVPPALRAQAREVIEADELGTAEARKEEAETATEEVGGRPGNAAYVIFTSGSTGAPRGVVVTREALLNHATVMAARLGLSASDRVLQFASLAFDVAVEELFPSWISGATVVARPEAATLSGGELLRFVEEQRLTVLNLPSPFWHGWVEELTPARVTALATLRVMVVGSDVTQASALARWRSLFGTSVAWYNAYGPTEATVTATLYEADAEAMSEGPVVPIGRAIANTEAHVLDARMERVPDGQDGELFIGGPGLARGYLGAADLTAARFVPHPFGRPGSRLYRTGDRVRRRRDGQLEYVGRLDDQLKIRGVRVEPAEVEHVLMDHPQVEEAVVVARGSASGKQLIAYLRPADPRLTAGEVREYLAQRLPGPMVPAAVVFAERSLPRTAGGKLDRRAVAELPEVQTGARGPRVSPRTALEGTLARLWTEVLELEDVGVEEDFFALGGHSLLAMRLAARVRETLGVELPVPALFEAPTVAALARQMEALGPDPAAGARASCR